MDGETFGQGGQLLQVEVQLKPSSFVPCLLCTLVVSGRKRLGPSWLRTPILTSLVLIRDQQPHDL